MNDNVVQLRAPKIGDHTFMVCGCDPKDPSAFIPIVILQQHPVVVGVMCAGCDTRLNVLNGVVQEKAPGVG